MSSSAKSDLQISELQSKAVVDEQHKKSTLDASQSPEKLDQSNCGFSDSEDPSEAASQEENDRLKRHTEMALQAAKKFDYSFDSSDYGDESETNSQLKKSVKPLPKGTIQEDSDEDLESSENPQGHISRQNDSNKSPGADNDFYKLSDLEGSSAKKDNLGGRSRETSNSAIRIDVAANDVASAFGDSSFMESSILSASQKQRQTSMAKISSLLDSHLQSERSDVRDLVENEKQLYRSEMSKETDRDKIVLNFMGSGLGVNKPQTEMTFGDLSSSEHSRTQSQATADNLQKEAKPAPSEKSLQEDLELLSNSCFTLSNSQLSQFKGSLQNPTTLRGYQISKGLDRQSLEKQELTPNKNIEAAGLILSILQTKSERMSAKTALCEWRLATRSAYFQNKVQNAAQMVDRMSKFSRNFISLNSLSAIVKKHQQRKLARAMIKWVRTSQKQPAQIQQQEVPAKIDHELQSLKAQIQRQKDLLAEKDNELAKKDKIIAQKEQEISKTESMFKEYQNFRGKLEVIETRMKQEVEHWKDAGQKLQRENTMLQKEALKMSKEVMDRNNQVKNLEKELEQLKEKADIVEEALCHKCQNSLEESFYGETPKKQAVIDPKPEHSSVSREDFESITKQMGNLEKQLLKYRERVSYHESMEEELKKNLEQQVDVILKMEEERLTLLKEYKESQEDTEELQQEKQDLLGQIDTLKSQISEFDAELKELKELIKTQQKSQKENKNVTNNTAKKTTPVSASAVKRPQTGTVVSKPSLALKKTPSTLKFQQPKQSPEAQVCIQCKVALKNKQLQSDPATKGLAQDNQLLTNELVLLNRELAKLKAEQRSSNESHKKSEKENHEFRKQIGSKDNALEKLRKERDELWAIVNTDKYKSIRCVESEKEQFEIKVANLESQLKKAQTSITTGNEEVEELKGKVQELTYEGDRLRERDSARERLITTLEGKVRRFEQEVDEGDTQNNQMRQELEEFKTENSQLKQDLSWLANQAKNSKAQADKSLADLQSYTQILRGMEKKLAEVTQEKAACQEELRQTQQSFMTVMQKHQVSSIGAAVTANVTKPQMNVWVPQANQSMPPTPSSYPSQHF